MTKFQEVRKENIEKLELYVPVVERVHGKEHPEFHEVRRIFDEINEKMKKEDNENLKLEDDFNSLREVTDDYKVPSDTCESYEAVYQMLSELDKAYHS